MFMKGNYWMHYWFTNMFEDDLEDMLCLRYNDNILEAIWVALATGHDTIDECLVHSAYGHVRDAGLDFVPQKCDNPILEQLCF